MVITGASTGIGAACATHLRGLGFRIFGGVRKPEDAERLRSAGAEPLTIDVTDADSIRSAASQLGDAPLAGLVNNAGVAVAGPVEFVPIEELRHQLEVNVIGQVAVTQAFLPALRRARGRVVNIGSIGGRVALPLLSPYAASKFALEAITDSLRRELRPWGMHVSIVEPGAVATPIWDKSRAANEEVASRMPPESLELYGKLIDRIRTETIGLGETGTPPRQGGRGGGARPDGKPPQDALPRGQRGEEPRPRGGAAAGPRVRRADSAHARHLSGVRARLTCSVLG